MDSEHIMIDGYNMIFRIPDLRDQGHRDLESARGELVRRIGEAFRGRRERITIVFDGNRDVIAGRAERSGGVRVVFSSPPETADHRIQRLVEEARRAVGGEGRLPVRIVSSDREVAGRARLWGARAVGVEEFLREVEARRHTGAKGLRIASKSAKPLSEKEVQMWEDIFRDRRRKAEDSESGNDPGGEDTKG